MATKPFTLDTVLEYRQLLEDAAKNDLFNARKDEELARIKIEEQQTVYSNLNQQWMEMQQQECPILDLISVEAKIAYAKQKIKELQVILEDKIKLVQKAQKLLILRSKEKKVMEKLKEKQNTQWQKYLNKKEAAMLDEIAILRHSR